MSATTRYEDELAAEVRELTAERDRAIRWAVEMECQATALERLLHDAHKVLADLINALDPDEETP